MNESKESRARETLYGTFLLYMHWPESRPIKTAWMDGYQMGMMRRAKLDRTEELIAAIREIYGLIKARLNEEALIVCEDIVAGDMPPAEQEES